MGWGQWVTSERYREKEGLTVANLPHGVLVSSWVDHHKDWESGIGDNQIPWIQWSMWAGSRAGHSDQRMEDSRMLGADCLQASHLWTHLFFFLFFFFLVFLRLHLQQAYGSSQARGRIGATGAGLCHSHSNWRSLTHWVRLGIKPESSWILVRFLTCWATTGTPLLSVSELGIRRTIQPSECEDFSSVSLCVASDCLISLLSTPQYIHPFHR